MRNTLCVLGMCLVLSTIGFTQGEAPRPVVPEKPTVTTAIPGVVAANVKVERIWTGNQSADGIVGAPDGSLMFTEQSANRVSRMEPNGKYSIAFENVTGAGALAYDYKGQLLVIERVNPRVEMLSPTRKVLVDKTEGNPIEMIADLVPDKKGGLYFTETRMPPRQSTTYYIKPDGEVVKATDKVARGNGVLLTADDKTIFFTGTGNDYIVAFDVQPDGSLTNQRNWGDPVNRGGDGLSLDSEGRLYVAGPTGVTVMSPEGKHLGTIPTPRPATSVAFAGPEKKTMYITARTNDGLEGNAQWARSMYRVSMLAQGYKGRAK